MRNCWNSASSSSVLESAGPLFPEASFTIIMPCEHPLLHPLYILSGVGNEAVKAERFRTLLSAKERSPIHDSENDPREADGGKDGHTVDKQLSALHAIMERILLDP